VQEVESPSAARTDAGFVAHDLGGGARFWTGRLPAALVPDAEGFETLWRLHPAEFHEIKMHGRSVRTPRWQQAYGKDYFYSGVVNRALPVPPELRPFLDWARTAIDRQLNALLLNWYDGKLGHYIGRHRDSVKGMIDATPIVTISLGEERIFRLRRWPFAAGQTPLDFRAENGSVFIMDRETNRAFTHEVPRTSTAVGRRISITLRGFVDMQ
jgi:alkylated DNA repair dioxygenase AlkB